MRFFFWVSNSELIEIRRFDKTLSVMDTIWPESLIDKRSKWFQIRMRWAFIDNKIFETFFLKTRVMLKVARNLVTEDPRLMMKRAAVEFRQSHLKTVS